MNKLEKKPHRGKSLAAYNSTYKKLAVEWLNEHLCFVSSSLLVDSYVLRNRQLLVAANHWWLPQEDYSRCTKRKF